MHIEIKVSIWQKMTLPEDMTPEDIQELKDCIDSEAPLPEWIYEHPGYELEWMYDTEEVLYDYVEIWDTLPGKDIPSKIYPQPK